MLLCSTAKWWGDFGYRKSSHEGLDIVMYRDVNNRVVGLHDKVKVPAMAGGTVINVCKDFLGKSVIVRYRDCPENNSRFVLVYSHIQPSSDIVYGKTVVKGDILGNISNTTDRKSKIPCHLHISIIEISNGIDDSRLNWDLFTAPAPPGVNFYNPWTFTFDDP